ncbi:hypothetical protein BpHYR1_048606 [Brachionus plicatilis]|uniref:Uncharacterized protein n=1 Tax=Brachionus plicatilis TaxID=10195 RepID=A0A3M7Q5S0_BRAPC|nr:hypothetical protein BpHYR1_048606 [Brachionus plicatilis]
MIDKLAITNSLNEQFNSVFVKDIENDEMPDFQSIFVNERSFLLKKFSVKFADDTTISRYKLTLFFVNFCQSSFKFGLKNFNDVNNFLEKYGLYAFKRRFLERMNSANLIQPMAKTNSGEKTSGFFYSRLINSFVIKRSKLKFATFKLSIYNNINLIFIDFC